jgi:protein-S-isoprenylcysteine O-methyltransferase Ste14
MTEQMATNSDKELITKTLTRYLLALVFVGAMIFIPAGSLRFINGWLYIGAFFIPMSFVVIYLLLNDPELLAKRLKTDEKEKPQKLYLVLSLIVSVLTFVIPGLDYKNHWSSVPVWLVILSTVLMLAGYLMFFVVMRQNSYASRVIEIQEKQKLIDTGLYSLVRHPLYLSATIFYFFTPLVLGSFYAMIPMIFIVGLLIMRIKNEEKVLLKGLDGYGEYMKKVKYRILPFIW